MKNSYLLCDGRHGIYSWQLVARLLIEAKKAGAINIPEPVDDILSDILIGPWTEEGESREDYWFAVEELGEQEYTFADKSRGVCYNIVEQEGDLWAMAEGESFYDDEEE